jgi:hypothetical protein
MEARENDYSTTDAKWYRGDDNNSTSPQLYFQAFNSNIAVALLTCGITLYFIYEVKHGMKAKSERRHDFPSPPAHL